MAVALRHYLCNPHLLETAIGTNLDRSVVENLVLLSDCVYHVLVSGKGKLGSILLKTKHMLTVVGLNTRAWLFKTNDVVS